MGHGASKKAPPPPAADTGESSQPVPGRTVTSDDSRPTNDESDSGDAKKTTAPLRKPFPKQRPKLPDLASASHEPPGFLAYDDDDSDEGGTEHSLRHRGPKTLNSPVDEKRRLAPARGTPLEGGTYYEIPAPIANANPPGHVNRYSGQKEGTRTQPVIAKNHHGKQAGGGTAQLTYNQKRFNFNHIFFDENHQMRHPTFDKERFRKANKERMSQIHSDTDPPPAIFHHLSHSTRTKAPEPQENFLDESDEDFMAEILRETDFVVADRQMGMI